MASPFLEVRDVKVHFPATPAIFRRGRRGIVKAVDGVSFSIARGETLGLVGESGCGKTTLARTILRLYRPTSGEVYFDGQDLSLLSQAELARLRPSMQLIFQDPTDSLDPRLNAGDIVGEPLRIQGHVSGNEYRQFVGGLLLLVGLSPDMASRFPHEFSAGQRQRLGIARAFALRPKLVICDEPVSSLDVSVQAQILNLLDDIQRRTGVSYLFVSHDLSVVRHVSHRIAVMYLGKIVEIAGADDLCRRPLHPYAEALLSAVPIPDPEIESLRPRIVLSGETPSPADPPSGCVFHPRCPKRFGSCHIVVPGLADAGAGRMVSCLLFESSWPAPN
ncbi:MAG: ABC transporter ATP-binding protein [Chloroflexi bacterium]|nr:ABC transporter ATP-binding protein [Chloroflexota bacterium]